MSDKFAVIEGMKEMDDALGAEAESIARDIRNVVEIIGGFGVEGANRHIVCSMLPVVLDAANRAAYKEVEKLAELVKKEHTQDILLMHLSVRMASLGGKIAKRKANEAQEAA